MSRVHPPLRRHSRRRTALQRARSAPAVAALVCAVLAASGCSTDDDGAPATTDPDIGAEQFLPSLPPNPHLGPEGTATSHGDSGSSDTTPLMGPGTGPVAVTLLEVGAVCPSILVGSDGYPVALCTRIADLRPVVLLLDPDTGATLASLELTPGSLFGGVYAYMDSSDRMVLVDGAPELLRIGHRRDGQRWTLEVDSRRSLAEAVPPDDGVTSLTPGYGGEVWFATGGGTVGAVDQDDATVQSIALPPGERIANSISSAPNGTAVASDHAVYLFELDPDGRIVQRWRRSYDRGPARKPGQLSWGTGSTPTFFGPTDGADYVTVVDNAEPEVHLVVIRASGEDAGTEVCSPTVLVQGGPGSENSPIGAGRSVVVASTYGYAYPRLPEDAGPSRPESAPFEGGMTRVDVREDGNGCDVVWDSTLASVAVPKLSTADGTITTVTRSSPTGSSEDGAAQPVTHFYTVISADTGNVLTRQELAPGTPDPLQLAGTTGPGRVLLQGTLGSILRIEPRPDGG